MLDLWFVGFAAVLLAIVAYIITCMFREALKHTQPVDGVFCYSSMEEELRSE